MNNQVIVEHRLYSKPFLMLKTELSEITLLHILLNVLNMFWKALWALCVADIHKTISLRVISIVFFHKMCHNLQNMGINQYEGAEWKKHCWVVVFSEFAEESSSINIPTQKEKRADTKNKSEASHRHSTSFEMFVRF